GALGAIASQALGGGNAGSFLTGGFAGGNPAAAALGGGGGTGNLLGSVFNSPTSGNGLGGLLRKIPGIGGFFGGGKNTTGPEMVGGLPGFKNLPVQLSGMPNIGGVAQASGEVSGNPLVLSRIPLPGRHFWGSGTATADAARRFV